LNCDESSKKDVDLRWDFSEKFGSALCGIKSCLKRRYRKLIPQVSSSLHKYNSLDGLNLVAKLSISTQKTSTLWVAPLIVAMIPIILLRPR
jgi:hypothetical protein